jgi:hypothetical protein
MKYQVQISYTNPSHEHVTLRRRVETITRLVEASTEGEALNRAANQQRALGFKIQEAKVLQPLQPISLKEEVEQIDELKASTLGSYIKKAQTDTVDRSFDIAANEPFVNRNDKINKAFKRDVHVLGKRMSGINRAVDRLTKEEVEQVDEVNRNKTKTDDHGGRYLAGLELDRKIKELERKISKMSPNDGGGRYLAGRELDKMKAMKEEAEQVDEANMRFDPEAAATPKSRDVQNFRMKDTNRRAGALSKKYVRRMTKMGGLGPNQTKKDTEAHMKANFGEEVGADKRDAGYKMSPAVRKAQAESDRLSKVVKPVQAGTLAAQRRRAEMKKEAVDLSEKEVINNKKSKAADTAKKMVNAAKGKMNKINLDPKVDTDSQKTKA